MVRYDVAWWAETQAASGLVGVTAGNDTRYRATGDILELRGSKGAPTLLYAMGQGANITRYRIVPADENLAYDYRVGVNLRTSPLLNPPSFSFSPMFPLQRLTGQLDNANNNEDGIIIAGIGYGLNSMPFTLDAPVDLPKGVKEMKWFTATGSTTLSAVLTTITDVALTWTGLKPQTNYVILGMAGWSAEGVFFTLDLNDFQDFRPGWPAGVSSLTARPVYFRIGHRPVFNGTSPPNMRMVSSAADTAEFLSVLLGELSPIKS